MISNLITDTSRFKRSLPEITLCNLAYPLGLVEHFGCAFWGVDRHFMPSAQNMHIIEITAPITTKFCTVTKTTKYSSWVVQTRVKQIRDGERSPSWKIENRPYLRNVLTNLREIWHDDAYWACERERKLKFPTFENPRWRTAAILKN